MGYRFRLLVHFLDFYIYEGYFKSLDSAVRFSLDFVDDCTFFLENIHSEHEYPIDALREVLRNA